MKVNNYVQMTNPKTGKITIALWVSPNLCIHKKITSLSVGDYTKWQSNLVLSHIKSGYRLIDLFNRTKQKALLDIQQLEAKFDWSFTSLDEFSRLSHNTKKAMYNACAELQTDK